MRVTDKKGASAGVHISDKWGLGLAFQIEDVLERRKDRVFKEALIFVVLGYRAYWVRLLRWEAKGYE